MSNEENIIKPKKMERSTWLIVFMILFFGVVLLTIGYLTQINVIVQPALWLLSGIGSLIILILLKNYLFHPIFIITKALLEKYSSQKENQNG